ncbi:MAG: protein kinase [Gemmatimonadota bacterium]
MTIEAEELVARLQAALGTHYRIERELGRGGMGMVFLATDTALDRPVAVKVMHPDLSVHGSIIQRFLAEARMIARLRHPNIVAVHAAGEATGIFYYVMDHVPGETLRERLNRAGKLDPEETGRILADMADALAAAGQAGLVHRDIKPENILLDAATGRALLADFGIARVAAAETSLQLTGQGIAVGTPTYMSPEQAAGETVDTRSDLYGLGIVGYEMLAGQPPFRGANGAAVISLQLSEKPVPIERLRPDTPPALAATIMRALEKSPDRRWQTGTEMRRALDGDPGPRLPKIPGRARRAPVMMAVGVLVLILGAVGLALAGGDGPPRGVNPRHSMLILPFDNLRDDHTVDWLREGSVNMLSLNMSQWNDLSVVDHERLHDLLSHQKLAGDAPIGLEMARQLARDAGVWTVVLGDFTRSGDSLHLAARVYDVASGERIDVAQVDGQSGEDPRPLYDQLAARLLDLSGAPGAVRSNLSSLTTRSLEAYRAYLRGIDLLNQWELTSAEQEFRQALDEDSTFGLAYYKLALTRGWMIGANDSTSFQAIGQATRFSAGLPQHERTVINAYRAFLNSDYVTSQSLYRSLLARDSNDADAWYGLGDALFHDSSSVNLARNRTASLRSFNRTLQLDPAYTLAYEHIMNMLTDASSDRPFMALVGRDSFVLAFGKNGQPSLDSARIRQAIVLGRAEALAAGRQWVTNQPDAIRAHTNLIEVLIASRDFDGALAELQRTRAMPAGATRPDLVFTEGRIRFASGDIEGAAEVFRHAMDTVEAGDFSLAPPSSYVEVNTAAGVFSYVGDLDAATRAIQLGDSVRRLIRPGMIDEHAYENFQRVALGMLYAGSGGPVPELRHLWESAAEEARTATQSRRPDLARSGTPAAVGLFGEGDTTALTELKALTREPLAKEFRALIAVKRGESAEARRILGEEDSTEMRMGWSGDITDRRPYAAQAWYLLGDYQRAIDILDGFDPEHLYKRGFDYRWSMVGRVRLLRAAALEKLGRRAAAATEYRAVLAQWKESTSPVLEPYLRQAQQGLARTTGEG